MDRETADIEITGLAHGGDGVGRRDGEVFFVPYALPGDTVRIAVENRARGVARGRIETLVAASPHRVAAPCPAFGRCGGCQWLHFDYAGQARWKLQIVRDCLQRIGGIDIEPEWGGDADPPLGYRTRATFHREGNHWGFYEARSHRVVPIEQCPLCHPKLNAAFARLSASDAAGPVELTVNPEGDEVLAWSREEQPALREAFPSANSQRDPIPAQFLFDGVPIVNGAFSQASLLLNRNLRRWVADLAGSPDTVLDLYCGSGNLTLLFNRARRAFGIDGERRAIDAARKLNKARFRTGREKDFIAAATRETWDLIMLDPPRAGARRVVEGIAACSAGAILYVSCDPATLARDAARLCGHGWRITRAIVLDLFPQTAHVETICRFDRPETVKNGLEN